MATETRFNQTASRIITRAFRKIGVTNPSAQESSDALEELNSMIKAWQGENVIVPVMTEENFPLSVGIGTYNVGPAATFDTTRPLSVNAAWRRNVDGNDTPLVEMSRSEYQRIWNKTQSGTPAQFYYDDQFDIAKLFIYPVPALAETLFIDSLKPFSKFANLSSNAVFPEEWLNAIVWNLAVDLAPEFGADVSVTVAGRAKALMRVVKRFNSKVPIMQVDSALLVR